MSETPGPYRVHDPGNKLRIEAIWAFLSWDEEGNEGLCAVQAPDGAMIPLIADDEARLKSLRVLAKQLKRHTNKKIRLVRFYLKEVIEEI